jgi:hypothetical protein
MKISLLTKVARQVEGEFVFINVIKATTSPNSLRKYLYDNELPRTEKVGDVDCVIEYGILEDVEVETEDESTSDPQSQ